MGLSSADEDAARVVAGRYRLESVLGRGGMGVVWRAADTLIERRVAIKELHAPADVPEGEESSFVERALREARNAGRLNHPGVVGVHDVISPTDGSGAVYIVMELVQAPTLAEVIDREGPLPASRVARMGLGILDAVMAAHTMGIVHRDIKPGNVLVREGDHVKLTDFGIALAAEDTRLTSSGVLGTHAYLAPECFDPGQAGPAADLWALGATLFHAVARRAPFDRDTTTATLRAILFEDVPAPPCEPPLADVITGLLTRRVDQRLTGGVARDLLQRVAAEPLRAEPTVATPLGAGVGRAAWEARATSVHRPPPPSSPAAGPWAHPAPPSGQPTLPAPSAVEPWAPPPPPPRPSTHLAPPSGGQGRATVLVVCASLLVVVAAVGAIVHVNGGDDGESSDPRSDDLPTFDDGAQGTIVAFFDAMNDDDCTTLAELVTDELLREDLPPDISEAEAIEQCEQDARSIGTVELGEMEVVHEDHDSILYNVSYSVEDLGGQEVRAGMRLVRGPGRWLVDEFAQVS